MAGARRKALRKRRPYESLQSIGPKARSEAPGDQLSSVCHWFSRAARAALRAPMAT